MPNEFFQAAPELHNTFQQNRWLAAYLKWKMPPEILSEVVRDLSSLGENCAGAYLELARRAEREIPEHVPFDAWGRRIDDIRVSPAWRELQRVSAREGLVAIGYQRKQGEHSRLFQFAKLYLFHPSSAFFTCPLAMADGAAKVLESYGRESIHRDTFSHLTSSDPDQFWTSGQWMTEKTGGSDVSGTATVARTEAGCYRLSGVKWFSSATTSEVALALARIEGAPEGSRGLSLFLVPVYSKPGQLNGMEVLRLKDKLGTRALPTAELKLTGAQAFLVGEKEQGVKTVATMLNITRLYNSICAVGQMTRALELLRSYASQRRAFGGLLKDHPLHQIMAAEQEARNLAGFLLTMEMVHLLGREEYGTASEIDRELLRLFTPITKMFTAKLSLSAASEVVEGFGGAGYVEDTGIPLQLRDSQVFSIWEGATNVLSLDLVRVVQKSAAFPKILAEMDRRGCRRLESWAADRARFEAWASGSMEQQVANSTKVAFALAWNLAALLILEWSDQDSKNRPALQRACCHIQRELKSWSLDADASESAGFLTDQLNV